MVAMMHNPLRPTPPLRLVDAPPEPSSTAPEAIIRVENLSIVFDVPRGEVIAVDRVSLAVMPGEFVSLVGPSGCGKSTLLNAMAGLERPFEGEVIVAGKPMLAPRPDIGMVFQQPHLFP